MTTPRQLYDKLPKTEYTSQWGRYQKNELRYGNGHNGGNVEHYALSCRKDYNKNKHTYAFTSDSHFRQCDLKPFEQSSYYKDHKIAIDELKKGRSADLIDLCKAKAGANKTSGDLYKGSRVCIKEMEKLCKKGISYVPCKYIKENKPDIYEDLMSHYCFGNNKDENANKSVCMDYYKDNFNNIIEENLKNFCQTNYDKTPRYKHSKYKSMCQCYKPASYYQNIRDSIRKKWKGPPGMDTRPQCIYEECLNSELYDKKDECRPLNFTQCIQNVDFDVHGNLTNEGTIKFGQEATCGAWEEKPTPSSSSSSTPMSKSEAEKKLKETQEKYNLQKDEPGIFDNIKTDDPKVLVLIFLLVLLIIVIITMSIQYFMSSDDNLSYDDNDNL